jgi:hypothetical protein
MSRKSDYSEEIADKICDGLMSGLSLVKVCEQKGMPHRVTVIRWMEANEAFATRCARARVAQADLMDDKILDVAENCTSETAFADKVKIAAYQWRAAKLAPKKYGDKLEVDHTGQVGLIGRIPSDEEWAEDAGMDAKPILVVDNS